MGFGHEGSRNRATGLTVKRRSRGDSALVIVRPRKGSECPAFYACEWSVIFYAGSADNSEVQCPQRVALMGIVDRQ